MNEPATEIERNVLINDLREAYMEVFPAKGIEEKLSVLPANSYVAVTCSPSKGVGETLNLCERLLASGFRVTPHIAAKNVRGQDHLADIMATIRRLRIESIFVPGGDRSEPEGPFTTALELLQAIDSFDHDIREIGVAAHPEGHPDIDDATLLAALRAKQPLAHYLVTQMCFDADAFGQWLAQVRDAGIDLPVWIGLPGAIDRSRLLATSLRIGVGDSLRFLKRKPSAAAELMKTSAYQPDDLVVGLARYQAMPGANVAGYHLFCFNQVASTENWRNAAIEALA